MRKTQKNDTLIAHTNTLTSTTPVAAKQSRASCLGKNVMWRDEDVLCSVWNSVFSSSHWRSLVNMETQCAISVEGKKFSEFCLFFVRTWILIIERIFSRKTFFLIFRLKKLWKFMNHFEIEKSLVAFSCEFSRQRSRKKWFFKSLWVVVSPSSL